MSIFVREWCAAKGLSQQELATRMGIEKSQMSKLLNGKQEWKIHHLEQAANSLEIDVRELFSNPIDADITDELVAAVRRVPKENAASLLKMLQALNAA